MIKMIKYVFVKGKFMCARADVNCIFFSLLQIEITNRVIIVTAALDTHMHTLWIISGVMHAAI